MVNDYKQSISRISDEINKLQPSVHATNTVFTNDYSKIIIWILFYFLFFSFTITILGLLDYDVTSIYKIIFMLSIFIILYIYIIKH